MSFVSLWISKAIVLLPEPPISTMRQIPKIVLVAAKVPRLYPVPLATTVEPLHVMVLASIMRERNGADAPCHVYLLSYEVAEANIILERPTPGAGGLNLHSKPRLNSHLAGSRRSKK